MRFKRISNAEDSLEPKNVQKRGHKNDIYSMASLEMHLSKNLDPLLRWACEKDHTAENIVFLRAVRDFKKKWTAAEKRAKLTDQQLRDRFEDAAFIWFKLVNPLTAQFNININYQIYSELEQIFNGLMYEPHDHMESNMHIKSDNVIAPWADLENPPSGKSQASIECRLSDVDRLYILPITEIRSADGAGDYIDTLFLCIPSAFSLEVFDKSYESVKIDVFRNTWSRYEARFSRPPQGHSPNTAMSPFPKEPLYGRVKPPSRLKRTTKRLVWNMWPFGSRSAAQVHVC
jgi:hypothetical protein